MVSLIQKESMKGETQGTIKMDTPDSPLAIQDSDAKGSHVPLSRGARHS